ncbi:MAG TPA: sigma factor-like helix-turn-helix DNA-binding protein [Candidatus Acidoferrum sp.]|nr:sigma factor-like helix-turn-helix DNA-binding protein [Candidatus Acidoferrum sp.]
MSKSQKNLRVALLLDYYGGLLTEKQREVVDLYYNEDLSLAEISELAGITRQGVRDSIKRGEAQLLEMEDKLGLVARITALETAIDRVEELSSKLSEYAAQNIVVRPAAQMAQDISETIAKARTTANAL